MESVYGAIKQNTIDAGCDDLLVSKLMQLYSEQKISEMLSLLLVHRRKILDGVHSEERKIYCLDYLINKLKKDYI